MDHRPPRRSAPPTLASLRACGASVLITLTLLLAIATPAAADEGSAAPVADTSGGADAHDAWGPFGDLEALRFSFYDTHSNAFVKVIGPYQLVYWDHDRVEMIGHTPEAIESVKIVLMRQHDQFWAKLSMVGLGTQYLTRVE